MQRACEAVDEHGVDCGRRSEQGVSVRHRFSDVWQCWPVCVDHVEVMPAELRGIGFVVSPVYRLGDAAGRQATEIETDVEVRDWAAGL